MPLTPREQAMLKQANAHSSRRDLLRRYVVLQRELAEGDPASSSYQATIQAFRSMGYMLIASGLEDDLDRLLRIRVLEGGKRKRHAKRSPVPKDLVIIEQRPAR